MVYHVRCILYIYIQYNVNYNMNYNILNLSIKPIPAYMMRTCFILFDFGTEPLLAKRNPKF